MTLVECRHHSESEITSIGEDRRRFLCNDCGQERLGQDPQTCKHLTVTKVVESSDLWYCEPCMRLFCLVPQP